MCVQQLNCRPPLGDDGQPFDWRSPHLFISSMTGVPRNPNVAPFSQVLCPWPRPVTGPKNLQPWCCSRFSASCHIGNFKWCSVYCQPNSPPDSPMPSNTGFQNCRSSIPACRKMGAGVSVPSNESWSGALPGESQSNCLAAGKENLITYSFENLTILPFKKTWLSEERKQK